MQKVTASQAKATVVRAVSASKQWVEETHQNLTQPTPPSPVSERFGNFAAKATVAGVEVGRSAGRAIGMGFLGILNTGIQVGTEILNGVNRARTAARDYKSQK